MARNPARVLGENQEGRTTRQHIIVRNITRRVAESARERVWDHNFAPKDALHIATAINANLELFNTFDMHLQKKSGLLDNPRLIIEPPSWIEPKLPMEMPHDETKGQKRVMPS